MITVKDINPNNRWLLRSQILQPVFYFYKQVAPPEHIYQKRCVTRDLIGEGRKIVPPEGFGWGEVNGIGFSGLQFKIRSE